MSASPQLSTLAGSALSGTRRNITTLWAALAKQVPIIRNATHYYAYDVQRLGRELYDQANATQTPSENEENGGSTHTHEAEAHYTPLSATDLGVSVKKVTLSKTKEGALILALCIEGGFALFEVKASSVAEICVELQHRDTSLVVEVLPLTRSRAIVVFTDALAFYDSTTRAMSAKMPLPDVASAAYLLRGKVAVMSAEYSQLAIFAFRDDNTFAEERHIIADRNIVAVSHRWLAYCGESQAVTEVRSHVQETTTSAVTKSLKDGIVKVGGLLAAASGSSSKSSERLGAVTVTDVETGRDVAAFIAHNHNIQCMQFDASGTILATASVSGTNVNLWHVSPTVRNNKAAGFVVLLARLSRGYTSGVITSIEFSPLNAWVAVSTNVGTCHIFELPTSISSRKGAAESSYCAPTIPATCRCRSAPMTSPVNPIVAFTSCVEQRPLRAVLVVAAASATVATFELTESGVRRLSTQHLTEFTLAVDETRNSEPSFAAPLKGEHLQADFVWRSQIELKTHPVNAKLRNLRILDRAQVQKSSCETEGTLEVANVDEDWSEA